MAKSRCLTTEELKGLLENKIPEGMKANCLLNAIMETNNDFCSCKYLRKIEDASVFKQVLVSARDGKIAILNNPSTELKGFNHQLDKFNAKYPETMTRDELADSFFCMTPTSTHPRATQEQQRPSYLTKILDAGGHAASTVSWVLGLSGHSR